MANNLKHIFHHENKRHSNTNAKPTSNPSTKNPNKQTWSSVIKKSASRQLPTKTSTFVEKNSENSDRSKLLKPKIVQKTCLDKNNFELGITNRFSDLDGDIEDGEAMDYNLAESSLSGCCPGCK